MLALLLPMGLSRAQAACVSAALGSIRASTQRSCVNTCQFTASSRGSNPLAPSGRPKHPFLNIPRRPSVWLRRRGSSTKCSSAIRSLSRAGGLGQIPSGNSARSTNDLIAGRSGEALVREGLADCQAGRRTVAARLIGVAGPRLTRAGLSLKLQANHLFAPCKGWPNQLL